MVYVGNNYTSTDLGPIAIDTIAKIAALIVGFATLVALGFLWNMVKGKF